MKKYVKRIISSSISMKTKELIDLIQESGCRVVSFDIFDTLIKRNTNRPEDVFKLLEDRYNRQFKESKPISKLRIESEIYANEETYNEEVTLDEIYESFLTEFTEDRVAWLKENEIELELLLCQMNYDIFPAYDWCISNNIKVLITSDMYLPLEVILKLLHKSGYKGWNKIYLSSEEKIRKSTGNLFKKILHDEMIDPIEMIHIGDALQGDYIAPKKIGIKAVLIENQKKGNEYYNRKIFNRENKKLKYEYGILNAFLQNNCTRQKDFYRTLGYCVVGPILYGYCKWLVNELNNNRIKKIFFLAREGYILEKAFQEFRADNIEYNVILVSRKATVTPLLYKANSLDDLMNLITVTRVNFTIMDLALSCGIDLLTIEKAVSGLNVSMDTKVGELGTGQKKALFDSIRENVASFSKEQEEYIKGYLKQVGFSGKIAVADVGWHGTIQSALQAIFPENGIKGFYIGKKHKKGKPDVDSMAFLFDDEKNDRIRQDIMGTVDLFEIFFLSTDGSAKEYAINDSGEYICKQYEPEQSDRNVIDITKLQEEALRFVKEFRVIDEELNIDMNADICEAGYNKLVNSTSMKTMERFKEFSFLNVDKHSLVAEHTLKYYMFRPQKFIEEFLNNGNKSLFLKSVFIVPLPYIRIIDALKKMER